MKTHLTTSEMKAIRQLGAATRERMDLLNSKTSSPGKRFQTLMITSLEQAHQLGYGGDLDDWIVFVKRS